MYKEVDRKGVLLFVGEVYYTDNKAGQWRDAADDGNCGCDGGV